MAEKIEFDLSVQKNELDKALNEGIKKSSQLEGTLSTALAVFGGNLITKGFDTLVDGLGSIISTGKEAISAAAGQEVAVNNLNNALARSGNFTRQASEDLLKFASVVQATTKFEDDAVIANTALLQSLTKLNVEGLKQGVAAAADFATILGIDLETATRLVAKAAEGNVEAFKRYNVEIKKGSTDSETFANAIEALNSKFGGAAASQLSTYNGSLQALKNSYADLLEPVGDIVVKNPIIISSFNTIKDIINGTNSEVSALTPVFQEFVQDGIFAVIAGSKVLFDALDGITIISKGLINTFQILSGGIAIGIVEPFKQLIDAAIFLGEKIPGVGDSFKGLVNPLDEASKSAIDFTKNGIDGLVNAADSNVFRKLSDGADQFASSIIDGAVDVKLASETIKNANNGRLTNESEVNAEILAARQQLSIDLIGLQQSTAIEQAAFDEQLRAAQIQGETERNNAQLEAIYTQKISEAQAVYEGELLKNKAIQDAKQRQLANDKAFESLKLTSTKLLNERILKEDQQLSVAQRRIQEGNLVATSNFIQAGLLLAKEGSLAQRALATTQAIVNTYAGATRAFVDYPFPASNIVAASVIALGLANVAKINGAKFENGGVVGQSQGAIAGADNRVATIKDGEMILNGQQQKNLFEMINNGSGSGDIIIKIDEREIARAVRNQKQQGFAI